MNTTFNKIPSSEYNADPIFSSKSFDIYGNAAIYDSPKFFCVDNYRYILITPSDIKENQSLAFKIATYLYHHETMSNRLPITYFFGDINKCTELGSSFTNQICKYVSYEMIEEWYPKNLSEINAYIINSFNILSMIYVICFLSLNT